MNKSRWHQFFKRQLNSQRMVVAITGLYFFFLAPQEPIHSRLSWLERTSVGLVALLVVLIVKKEPIRKIAYPVPMVALLVIMGFSIVQMPAFFVIRDYFAFVCMFIYAVVATNAVGYKSVMSGIALGAVLIMVFTAVYFLVDPEGSFYAPGEFKGAFYGPNSLPISLMFAVPAIFSLQLKHKLFSHWVKGLTLLSIFAFSVLSSSTTSSLTFVAILYGWAFFIYLQINRKISIVLGVVAAIGALLTVVFWVPITSLLGKTPDLTGRFPLWQGHWNAITEQPIWGYGWHAETKVEMPLAQKVIETAGFFQINANNDFLNWWSLTGIAGVAVAMSATIYLLYFGVKYSRHRNIAQLSFLYGILFIVGGLNETQSLLVEGWFVFNAIWAALVLNAQKIIKPPKWLALRV